MPDRYHPVLAILHWLLALCLVGLLFAGSVLLAPLPNDDPGKMISFRLHMGLGIVTLFLMVLRLAVRLSTRQPDPAVTGSPILDRLARANHWALYLLAFVMAGSGIAFARASGLPDAVFGSGPMPPDFEGLTARRIHGAAARLFMALIALHVAAALWHHFVRRDGVITRMWPRRG